MPVTRRWHLLDDGLLTYGLAALRTLWLAPLLQLAAATVAPEAEPLLGPLAIFGLLAGGTAAAQCGVFLWPGRYAPLGMALLGLGTVVLTLFLGAAGGPFALADGGSLRALAADPVRAVLTVGVASWLWWWGLVTGSGGITYDRLARNFVGGLAALLAAAAFNALLPFMPNDRLVVHLLAFGGLGLFALALASIQEARRFEGARSGHDLPLARHWWGTVAGVVATLLAAALLLGWLLAPASLLSIAAATASLLGLAGQAVAWLLLLVSYPIFWLLTWLASMLQIDQLPPPQPVETGSIGQQLQAGEQVVAGSGSLAPAVQATLGVLGVVGLACLIVLVFVLALRRYRTYQEEDVDEAHESILSLDLIKAQLAQLLRRPSGIGQAQEAPFVVLHGEDPRTQVRRIYQALLVWAAVRGIERAAAVTPEGFRRLLSERYPQHGEQFSVITAGYMRARYGASPVSDDRAAAVVAAWQEIRTAPD